MMAALLYHRVGTYLLWAIFMTSHHIFCDGTLTESRQNSTEANTTSPEIITSQGRLRGVNMVTRNNRTVFGFIGIPYAQPPIGDLRFKAPEPAQAWNGTLHNTNLTHSIVCPQFINGVLVGNEDCLNLHVYTPKIPTTRNSTILPVMVYIIGGAFAEQTNFPIHYGPDFLLDEDVVLVIPNFRLGVLGFLSTGDEVAPGNYALKDMVEALKWTQRNIQYFGGDPHRVTLFGGSSGAISVSLLALLNSTAGLFHKIITQSGSALASNLRVPRQKYANRATKLGGYLDCPTNTSTHLIACLRSVNTSRIVDSNSAFSVWRTYPEMIWYPTIEPNVEGALLTDTPANLIASGKISDLPWMSMVTWDEGFTKTLQFHEDPDSFEQFLNSIDIALPLILDYRDLGENGTAYTAALTSYYFNDLTANRSILLTNLTDLVGDGLFVYPVYSLMQQRLLFTKSNQYFCVLKYRGTFSKTYWLSGGSTEYTGVAHGDEIIYLFPNRYFSLAPAGSEFSEADWKMVDTMTQLWTSFAINGIPTTEHQNGKIWEPYSARNNYLRIGNGTDTTLEMRYDLFIDRMRFWDELMTASSGTDKYSLQALSMIVLCFYIISYVQLLF